MVGGRVVGGSVVGGSVVGGIVVGGIVVGGSVVGGRVVGGMVVGGRVVGRRVVGAYTDHLKKGITGETAIRESLAAAAEFASKVCGMNGAFGYGKKYE